VPGDVAQLGERQAPVAGDASSEPVRVHVGKPEHDRGRDDERGYVTGFVRKGLCARDEDGECDDRAVDEAGEALAHRRAAEALARTTTRGRGLILLH
jgi:hypothetical protein